jgi:hypothetical protein
MVELLLLLHKEEGGRYWRALFEGGEEKSHLQVCFVGWGSGLSQNLWHSFAQVGQPRVGLWQEEPPAGEY